METMDITVLHALGRGEPELSTSLEAELSLLGDSSRMACSDCHLLWVMSPTTVPESPPSGDGLKLPERLVMNSTSLEWMAGILSDLDTEQKQVSPVATVGLHR
jgi:hypothetical protein